MSYAPNAMSIPAGNRNVKNIPMDQDGLRDWSNGLCGCCEDFETCIIAWCFPCITYGQVKHRYEHLNNKGYPDPERGGCCSSDCMLHALLLYFGCGWALQMGLRGSIRGRYNIKGGSCSDCCVACWCTPCELTQEARELELEESTYAANGKQ